MPSYRCRSRTTAAEAAVGPVRSELFSRFHSLRLAHAGACAFPAAHVRAVRGQLPAAAVTSARRTTVAARAAAARGTPAAVGRRGDDGGRPRLRHELRADRGWVS